MMLHSREPPVNVGLSDLTAADSSVMLCSREPPVNIGLSVLTADDSSVDALLSETGSPWRLREPKGY